MTAVLDATPETATDDSAPEPPTASWLARAGAFSIDVLLGVAVIATMALLTLSAPQRGWLWWVFTGAAVLVFVLIAVNRLLLPCDHRVVAGARAVRHRGQEAATVRAVGLARLVARDLAHLLDTAALFIGWLWPLWDRRGRTFADLLLRTEVHKVDRPQRDVRRPAAAALIAATLLCAAGVGSELSGGVPVRPGGRRRPCADRVGRTAHRRTDAELRRRHAAAGLLPRPVADDRRISPAVDRPAAGRAEGGCHQERVLGGEQRGALGDGGPRVDAVGDAGPAWHRPEGSEVHHRDGAGRTSTSRATASGASRISPC